MNYDVILSPEFTQRFEKLQINLQKGVSRKLSILNEHPNYGRQLQGRLKGLWELKLGKLRIFYTIDNSAKKVRVVTIDFRGHLF